MGTTWIPSTQFSQAPGAVMDAIHNTGDAALVTNHGRPQVAIIDAKEYERLLTMRRELGVLREAEQARRKALAE